MVREPTAATQRDAQRLECTSFGRYSSIAYTTERKGYYC